MADNPLKRVFRQSNLSIRLPTKGRWYSSEDIELSAEKELAIFPMTALDDILLNTPDAMLNGQALEKVLMNCVPGIKNVKKLMLPDLDAIFVGLKSATNNGKVDYERNCPKCDAENVFDLNCQQLLNTMTFIDEDLLVVHIHDDGLIVHVKPHDFEMRQLYTKKDFEEQKILRALDMADEKADAEHKMNELIKADILAQHIYASFKSTFELVSKSIEKVVMTKDNITVVEQEHINEWLLNIGEPKTRLILDEINKLNNVGVIKILPVKCSSCGHDWEDTITFDPAGFFTKRS